MKSEKEMQRTINEEEKSTSIKLVGLKRWCFWLLILKYGVFDTGYD